MIKLKTLPLLDRTSTIIVEEDINVPYGKVLIAGWLQMWKEIEPNSIIELLSFANPKSWYLNGPKPYILNNVNISDYYTVELNKPKENFVNTLQDILARVTQKSIVFLDNLNSLILYAGLANSLQFVEKLNKKVERLICLFRKDCIPNKILSIETLGNTYVRLHKYCGMHSNNEFTYIANYIHRKSGGTIMLGSELVRQDIKTYEIQSENLKTQFNSGKNSTITNDASKIVSSFRIEINEHEMKQRENTLLPYVPATNMANNECKILYIPDEVDDVDEEDPDDDLCI
uniref:elongator complex protein 5 n=1 Tax=Vespula vulgaris TaxID=7454 RepID=UPI00212EED69|nr:elongator complex protein 5 [Vespula vulgaris]